MTINPSALSLVALVVATLGVVATLAAPFIRRSARLTHDALSIWEVRAAPLTGNVSLKIFHNGKEIDGDLYLFSVSFTNTGSLDIAFDESVDSVTFGFVDTADVLSADILAREGVIPRTEIRDGQVEVFWRMLKPQESVAVTGIAKARDERASVTELERAFSHSIRIRDVLTGKRSNAFRRVFRPAIFASAFATLLASLTLLMYSANDLSHYKFVSPVDGHEYLIGRALWPIAGLEKCVPLTDHQLLSRCGAPTSTDIDVMHRNVSLTTARMGVSPAFFAYLGILTLLFGLAAFVAELYAERLVARQRLSAPWFLREL